MVFKKGHIPKNKKFDTSKEELEKLYWEKGLTSREIAKILGLKVHKSVLDWMKKFDIPRRRDGFQKGHPTYPGVEKGWIKKGQHLSSETEFKKGDPSYWKDKTRSKETKNKISESRTGIPAWNKDKPWSIEHRDMLSKIRTERQIAKKQWQDPEYIKNVLKARQVRPNKEELQLDPLIQQARPNEFAYNGDFSQGITIGRRIPDWVNVNGKKQVIEYFGSFFHSPLKNSWVKWDRTEEETIKHYKKYGWKCLVIWDYELKNQENVIGKIKNFVGDKKWG